MNGLQRRGAGGRGRRPAAALLAAGALLGMVLASGLMAGCASRHHDDDHPAARGGPSLPPGVVQLTPVQQTAAGVRLVTVESRQVPRQVALPAQVEAPTGDSATARAPVTGYLVAPAHGFPPIGSWVRRGQLLALVQQAYSGTERVQLVANLSAAQAAAQSAAARLRQAREQWRRSQRLYEQGIAPRKQVELDRAAVEEAEAALQAALAQGREYRSAAAGGAGPSRFVVRAPISGRLAAVNAAPGELVQPQQSLFQVVNAAVAWAAAAVPEGDIAAVGRAPRAVLRLAAYPGCGFAMRRVASTGVVTAATHTLTVIYAAANRDGTLKPGMVGSLLLQSASRAPAAVIPQSALVYEPGGTVVFVALGKGRFRRQPVTVAYISGGEAVIATGLRAGQRVAAHGAGMLESTLHRGSIRDID